MVMGPVIVTAADALRAKRAECVRQMQSADTRTQEYEQDAKRARDDATAARELHDKLGDAIRQLEGPDAPLDFPTPPPPSRND